MSPLPLVPRIALSVVGLLAGCKEGNLATTRASPDEAQRGAERAESVPSSNDASLARVSMDSAAEDPADAAIAREAAVPSEDPERPPSPPDPRYRIDAIVGLADRAYFFRGDEYVRYAFSTGEADAGYPKSTTRYWTGLDSPLDAAVELSSRELALFRESYVYLYDLESDRSAPPQPIDEIFPGLGNEPIDAAFSIDELRAAFVRGRRVWEYDASLRRLVDLGELEDLFPGSFTDRVDAALRLADGALALFRDSEVVFWRDGEASPPEPYNCHFPGLWDPYEGTGDPGERLPASIEALLSPRLSATEIESRRAQLRAGLESSVTDVTNDFPEYVASLEEELQTWGCLLLRRTSGSHLFRCMPAVGPPRAIEILPFTVDHIDWSHAAYHVSQTSQGDFMAARGTPLSILRSDDGTFRVTQVTGGRTSNPNYYGVWIQVAFFLDGVEHRVGFAHLLESVPRYVLNAHRDGTALPVGTVFGFVGSTGNLGTGAPPDVDGPWNASSRLPAPHSHIWFHDDPENHIGLTPSMRCAIDYSGLYPNGD